MSPEMLLAQFDAVAEAPGGVQRLRELILQLAVRGKLVPQEVGDEPASVIVERSGAALAGKNNSAAIPFSSDPPNAIPNSWEWVRLEQIADLQIGRTPNTKVAAYWVHGDIPWVSIGDMPNYGRINGTGRSITMKAAEEIFGQPPAPAGTLLMSFKLSIGKVAFLHRPSYHNEAIVSIRPPVVEVAPYLHHCLRGIDLVSSTNKAIKGQTLNKNALRNLAIPLPPLAEQHRIVAKVDQLMALCDELEERQRRRAEQRARLNRSALHHLTAAEDDAELAAHWQRIQENFDLLYDAPEMVAELRQAILQLAVRGKLVPQDPRDEPAAALLERIEAEKERLVKEGMIGKPKKLAPVEAEEMPFEVPERWEWVPVGAAGEVKLGRQRSPQHHNGPHMRPYLRVANVQEAWLDLSDVKEMNFSPGEYEQFRLEPGDVLLNEGQSYELVGRPALYNGEIPGACFQNTLLRFRAYAGVVPAYSLVVFRAYMHNGRFRRHAQQTTNIAHLSAGRLVAIEFPLPPLPEQHRIVAKVDQLMVLCDELEARLTRCRTQAERLAAAVVHHLTAA